MSSLYSAKTDDLKALAMKHAAARAAGKTIKSDVKYTDVVRVLCSKLRSNPKKVRRQARTSFWD